MSLYDRDYTKNNSNELSQEELGAQQSSELSSYIKKTYQLFAASLFAGAAGAYIGMDFAYQIASFGLWALLPWLGLMFLLKAVKHTPVVNYIVFFAFTFFGGIVIAPTIAAYVGMGAGNLVVNAFVMTAVAFGGLSIFAMSTKRDFSFLGKMLFISLIVVIVAMLLNYFFVQSPFISVAVSVVCVVLFSAYILYDTQQIIRRGFETPIDGAISLYLDALNLFIHLLNILGFLNRD